MYPYKAAGCDCSANKHTYTHTVICTQHYHTNTPDFRQSSKFHNAEKIHHVTLSFLISNLTLHTHMNTGKFRHSPTDDPFKMITKNIWVESLKANSTLPPPPHPTQRPETFFEEKICVLSFSY